MILLGDDVEVLFDWIRALKYLVYAEMFGYSLENGKKITGSVVYPPRNYPLPLPHKSYPQMT